MAPRKWENEEDRKLLVAVAYQVTNINYEALSELFENRTPKAIRERLFQLKKKAVADGLVLDKNNAEDGESAPLATVAGKAVSKAKGGAKAAGNKDGKAAANTGTKGKGGNVKAAVAATKGKGKAKAKAVESDDDEIEGDESDAIDEDKDIDISDSGDEEYNADGDDEPEQEEPMAKAAASGKKKGTAVAKAKNTKAAAPKANTAAKVNATSTTSAAPTTRSGRAGAGKSTGTAIVIDVPNDIMDPPTSSMGLTKRKRDETGSAPAATTVTTSNASVKKVKTEPVDDDELLGLKDGKAVANVEEDEEDEDASLLGIEEAGELVEESTLA